MSSFFDESTLSSKPIRREGNQERGQLELEAAGGCWRLLEGTYKLICWTERGEGGGVGVCAETFRAEVGSQSSGYDVRLSLVV